MKPLTREWVMKAEEDFEVARRLSRSRSIPLCYENGCRECFEDLPIRSRNIAE